MTTKVRTGDLNATVDLLLAREAKLASGENGLLSKAEQAAAPGHIAQAAADIRVPGQSVKSDALSKHLSDQARTLTASVNQSSGVGRAYFSKSEAKAAAKADPILGARIEKAHAIASGSIVDVDGIAEARVRASMSDGIYIQFNSESVAENYRDPHNRHFSWLVKTGENSFVSGRNDLWSQRFDIDPKSGEVTITGEH